MDVKFIQGKASTLSDMVSAKLLEYGYVHLRVGVEYYKSDRLRHLANWLNGLADALDKQSIIVHNGEMEGHN